MVLLNQTYLFLFQRQHHLMHRVNFFGINQSVQSLAVIFPPILAGLISSVWVGAPVFVAGMCTLIAWIIFILYYRHEKEFHAI